MADVVASTLAKLKNKARQQGIQLQQLLNLFCQEEFIRRMSRSKYKDHLILKGGFLLGVQPTKSGKHTLSNFDIQKADFFYAKDNLFFGT